MIDCQATASVDTMTDELIQATLRDSFQHCTLLTIAHRLETIADYDMVVVMDRGQVVEVGSPFSLLHPNQNPAGEAATNNGNDLKSKNGNNSGSNSDSGAYDGNVCENVDVDASGSGGGGGGVFLGMVSGLGVDRRAALMSIARRRHEQSQQQH